MKEHGRNAQIAQTLVYYDGPQVMVLRGMRDRAFMAVAIDDGTKGWPFFCAEISDAQFEKYMLGLADLHYLMKFPKYRRWYRFDLYSAKDRKIYLQPARLNEEWLPEEGFFARDHTEENNSYELKREVRSIPLDGGWEVPEFSSFTGKYTDVYSFLCSLHNLSPRDEDDDDDDDEIERGFLSHPFDAYPWRGGFSSLNFYNTLYSRLPRSQRLHIKQMHMASPGSIEVHGNQGVLSDISSAVSAYVENLTEADETYRSVYRNLQKNGMLAMDKDDAKSSPGLMNIAEHQCRLLIGSIKFRHWEVVHVAAEENWLGTIKIILSYHRRLRELVQFYIEGRAGLDPSA